MLFVGMCKRFLARKGICRAQLLGWSNARIFSHIYERKIWGDSKASNEDFYSGSGSDDLNASKYCAFVRGFIREHRITSVVDIGCGDFRVGAQLRMQGISYVGVDVVPKLIERNNRCFKDESTYFVCADATKDPLPDGDICLIRQVLQHLSNAQIALVLQNTDRFRYRLITEHHPADERLTTWNKEMATGHSTRTDDGSGVSIEHPPFAQKSVKLVFEQPLLSGDVLRTFLIVRDAV